MKALVISQFNYCPLIWMFHNIALNNRINKIHGWVLRLVYQNKNLSFSELLELEPKIWPMVPQNIKNRKSLPEFKRLIKVWKPKACPCRMCKKYVSFD